jgi:hypothetical protein
MFYDIEREPDEHGKVVHFNLKHEKIAARKEDPYGFWYLYWVLEDGSFKPIPNVTFTDQTQAEIAAKAYDKPRETRVVQAAPTEKKKKT